MISKVDKNRIKTGGRKKGTPNKKTVSFRQALNEQGFDVSESMVSLYSSTDNDSIKLAIIELALKYSQPVPKAKEENNPDEEDSSEDTTDMSNDQLIKIIK